MLVDIPERFKVLNTTCFFSRICSGESENMVVYSYKGVLLPSHKHGPMCFIIKIPKVTCLKAQNMSV